MENHNLNHSKWNILTLYIVESKQLMQQTEAQLGSKIEEPSLLHNIAHHYYNQCPYLIFAIPTPSKISPKY
jgi:hypothetical protein